MRIVSAGFAAALVLLPAAGCGPGAGEADPADTPPPEVSAAVEADQTASQERDPNTLTDQERAEGWRLLFDGETTEGWRGFRLSDVPGGWTVEEGRLTRVASAGDLITEDTFDDFEIVLEWMVEPGGNSGLFFRATEEVEVIYFGAAEVQMLDDDGHADGASPLTSAGSNYALHPAPEGVARPAGEWNKFRITVDGARVEQWMNGVHVVTYELWSPEWEELVAASKFADWPEYARARSGHIGLQDHGDRVWFRNIRIREL